MEVQPKVDKIVLTRLVAAHITAHGQRPTREQFGDLMALATDIGEVSGLEPEMKTLIDLAKSLISEATPAVLVATAPQPKKK
jgi:hypothetical protein